MLCAIFKFCCNRLSLVFTILFIKSYYFKCKNLQTRTKSLTMNFKFTFSLTFLFLTLCSILSAQNVIYLHANETLTASPENAVVKIEKQIIDDNTFAIYRSRLQENEWQKSILESVVQKVAEDIYYAFDNKKLKGLYKKTEITEKTDLGFKIQQWDENNRLILTGNALQVFPLVLHGECTLFDLEGKPMENAAFLKGKQINEEFIFHPADSTLQITREPQFPGGGKAFQMEIAQNIRYPVSAIQNNTTGYIFIKFLINSKGKMEQVHAARSAEKIMNNEGVRVIKSIKKKWTPGECNSKKINVWYYTKITFQSVLKK